MYSSVITSSGSCSILPGVNEQVRTDRMSVSHKESTIHHLPNWNILTQVNLDPTNSARVLPSSNKDKRALVTHEVQELIRKEAIIKTTIFSTSFTLDLPGRRWAMSSHQFEGLEPVCTRGVVIMPE